jgi:hypothetical protein
VVSFPELPHVDEFYARDSWDYMAEHPVDLDPHRTATHLENGVPHCYLGHPDCYDRHDAERRADEVDYNADL